MNHIRVTTISGGDPTLNGSANARGRASGLENPAFPQVATLDGPGEPGVSVLCRGPPGALQEAAPRGEEGLLRSPLERLELSTDLRPGLADSSRRTVL